MPENISVLIVDQTIEEKGILSNAAFVLGLTAGRLIDENTFGQDAVDGEGKAHKYLTNIAHHVRKAGQNKIKTLRNTFSENPDVILVDYTEDAAPSDYNEYMRQLSLHKGEQIIYRAIHIYGPGEIIIPLTKNLSRL